MALALAPGVSRAAAGDDLAPIPPKFYVADPLESRFVDLWLRSPTFREQCRVIAETGAVVAIEIVPPSVLVQRRVHAWSSILKDAQGRVRFVRVRLADDKRWSVHLPHELEHVVEQIEGIDLDREARRRSGRAWLVSDGMYETVRARRAGEQADRELHGRDRVARQQDRSLLAARPALPSTSTRKPAP